jgi:cytochrome c oxidase subunit II
MSPKRTIALLAVCLGISACAPAAPNTQGVAIGGLYRLFFGVAIGVFVIVAGLISWSILRYRERPGDELPEQFHSNIRLELAWFAIPQLLVVALFVGSLLTLDKVNTAPARAITVGVQGFQWGWRFSYKGEDVEITSTPGAYPEIVLPVGRRVTFELTSEDVNHSFYVPRFLVKRDAIPGVTNRLHVTLDKEGAWRGACAEFCGLLHDRMEFRINAVSPARYETWLAARAGN